MERKIRLANKIRARMPVTSEALSALRPFSRIKQKGFPYEDETLGRFHEVNRLIRQEVKDVLHGRRSEHPWSDIQSARTDVPYWRKQVDEFEQYIAFGGVATCLLGLLILFGD